MNHLQSPVVQTNELARKYTPKEDDEDSSSSNKNRNGNNGYKCFLGEELQKISRRSSRHSSHRNHHLTDDGVTGINHSNNDSTSYHHQQQHHDGVRGLWYPQLEEDEIEEFGGDSVNNDDDDEFGRSLQNDWLDHRHNYADTIHHIHNNEDAMDSVTMTDDSRSNIMGNLSSINSTNSLFFPRRYMPDVPLHKPRR